MFLQYASLSCSYQDFNATSTYYPLVGRSRPTTNLVQLNGVCQCGKSTLYQSYIYLFVSLSVLYVPLVPLVKYWSMSFTVKAGSCENMQANYRRFIKREKNIDFIKIMELMQTNGDKQGLFFKTEGRIDCGGGLASVFHRFLSKKPHIVFL